MFCPGCGSDQIVVTNSRPTNKETQIWRRRRCLKCEMVFTTHEKIDLAHITVVKRSGRRVRYLGAKLYSSIYHAVVGQKKIDRGDAGVIAEGLFEKVEEKLIIKKRTEIKSREIADIVLKVLADNNLGAAMRYLAYFKIDGKNTGLAQTRKYLKKLECPENQDWMERNS